MSIPDLMGARVILGEPDFSITDPDFELDLPHGRGHVVADRRRAILRLADVGTFAVTNGAEVRVAPVPDPTPGAISMHLHGTVAALLLAQRGRFALHASVAEIAGAGVAVAGRQRAGKSTTALSLTQRGHTLVTDDVSPLELGDPVTVHPFSRPVYIHPETAVALAVDVSDARPVLEGQTKLALDTEPRDPVPLAAIVVRDPREGQEGIEVAPVAGGQTHWLLSANIYRPRLLVDIWRSEMFAWAAELARRVPLYVVSRPAAGWSVDEVAGAIEGVAAAAPRDGQRYGAA